jgi:hypothetical protein
MSSMEIEQGAWNVRPADVDTVLRFSSGGSGNR